MCTLRSTVAIAGVVLGSSLGLYAQDEHSPKPNIIFFMADDMGIGDTSAYQDLTGNTDDEQLATPNMERLSRMGVRFTDAHTPSSRCTGTRYGLLTGRYPWRNRMKHWVLFGAQGDPMIEADRPTIASMLKAQGYSTGIVGKWHVGLRYQTSDGKPAQGWADADLSKPLHTSATDFGFDFARFTSRSHGTSGPNAAAKSGKKKKNGPGHIHGRIAVGSAGQGKKLVSKGPNAYVLNELGSRHSDHAIQFLERHHKERSEFPFFLYYPANSNHGPHTPDNSIGGVKVRGASKSKSGSSMSVRSDFVYENDVALGRLLDWLEGKDDPRNPGHKLLDNTLVIFTSDNGAEIKTKVATGPWRSNKGSAFEGGHRVPFIAAWKTGRVGNGDPNSEGVTVDSRLNLVDMFATFCEATESPLPKLLEGEKGAEDSHSVLLAMQGGIQRNAGQQSGSSISLESQAIFHNDHQEAKPDRAQVAFRMDNVQVGDRMFPGQWKLFFDAQLLRFGVPKPYQLFDLKTDPMEQTNRFEEPELKSLIDELAKKALLHRNSGGHRWVAALDSLRKNAGPSITIDWTNAADAPWRKKETEAGAEGDVTISILKNGEPSDLSGLRRTDDGLAVASGDGQMTDNGEAISLAFKQDVLIEWIALKAGSGGSCGGFYRVDKGAPLAIYCIDADNDSEDQRGVLSDIGFLKAGDKLTLDSSPHFGTEPPGAWTIQAIQYRVIE